MFSIDALFIFFALILQVFLPGFPKETLLLQSGATYGLVFGSMLNWIGMVVAAQVAYEVVRKSVETGGKFSQILATHQSSRAVKYVEKRGNKGLFVIRLIPNAPNDVVSLISGGLFLPRKGYLLVSTTTAIPYAILFAYLGEIGKDFISTTTLFAVNAVFLGITVIIFLVAEKKRSRTMDDSSEQSTNDPSNTFD